MASICMSMATRLVCERGNDKLHAEAYDVERRVTDAYKISEIGIGSLRLPFNVSRFRSHRYGYPKTQVSNHSRASSLPNMARYT
jgi:hypothetical protein